MSWFSQNYEKAAVGGAAVAALAFVLLGWSKVGSVTEDFNVSTAGTGNNNPAVPSADLVPKAVASLGLSRSLAQAKVEDRPVDLFTGIALFIARSEPAKAVDLWRGAPIHPPIPNIWWIQNGLDPGFADSPSRDADDDGYTNLEEFLGKTDPKDPKSHPPLINKLKYEKDDSLNWFVRPVFPDGDNFTFQYGDNQGGKNRSKTGLTVKPGELFFTDGVMKNRFKYLGLEKRMEMNAATHTNTEVIYAKIEDQIDNKKGTVYEIPQFVEGNAQKFSKYDRSAELTLEAIGYEGKSETIKENTSFGLPFDSAKKNYLLKKVTPDDAEVEYTDAATGAKKTVTIHKGSFPETSP
ncbi:MAG: Amuc_1099 family pilus-like system protein [Verrucomicrobiota bacterium]